MKVVILAGGEGTRLSEETRVKAKAIPVKPYVRLKHIAFSSPERYFAALGQRLKEGDADFIDGTIFDPNPGVDGDTMTTSYASTAASSLVVDSAPRIISNLIVDQTANNPAAVAAQEAALAALGAGYQNAIPNPDFDPNLHQAVVSESSPEHREGEVIGELRRGYMMGDRLLRPAMVKVAKA